MSAHRLTTNLKGFTLIELLVVIAIIAILSVVGIAAFKGVTGGARDSTRRADIDAIAKAYEIQKTSGYIALSDSQFASGKKPQDPNSQKGDYFNWLATDGSGFKVCASLDDNPNTVCNTPAFNCYCKFSSQGSLNPSSPVNQGASTNYTFGLGGSSQSSCDTNGTLLSGLVGYWKMDESSGVLADSSGNGNTGTWYGTGSSHYTAGKFGNGGGFNGINDYVSTLITSAAYTATTQEVWIKANSGAWQGRIVTKGGGRFSLQKYTTNTIIFQLSTAGGSLGINLTTSFQENVWTHVVATYDGSTAKLYINGELRKTQGGVSGAIEDVGDALTIGADNGGGYAFNGSIDDVRIYNRVLSGLEISTLYNNGNGCIY